MALKRRPIGPRRTEILELAKLVDLLENYGRALEPKVVGAGSHGSLQAVVDAANLRIDELFAEIEAERVSRDGTADHAKVPPKPDRAVDAWRYRAMIERG